MRQELNLSNIKLDKPKLKLFQKIWLSFIDMF